MSDEVDRIRAKHPTGEWNEARDVGLLLARIDELLLDRVDSVKVERDAAIARAERAEARIAEDDALIDRIGYCHTCAVELAEEPGDRPPSVTCYHCACDHRRKAEGRLGAARALVARWRARVWAEMRDDHVCADELEAALGGPK